jgi:hypothetical protein
MTPVPMLATWSSKGDGTKMIHYRLPARFFSARRSFGSPTGSAAGGPPAAPDLPNGAVASKSHVNRSIRSTINYPLS